MIINQKRTIIDITRDFTPLIAGFFDFAIAALPCYTLMFCTICNICGYDLQHLGTLSQGTFR